MRKTVSTVHPASPTSPPRLVVCLPTDLSLPHLINTIPPLSRERRPFVLLTAGKHGTLTGHLNMATRYLDFKCTDSIRDVNLGTNLFPQRLCHRRSHVVILSFKAGILLPYLDIFDSDSCPCWQKRALSLPNDIQNAPAYIVSQNSMQISRHTYVSHIAAPFHPIRD